MNELGCVVVGIGGFVVLYGLFMVSQVTSHGGTYWNGSYIIPVVILILGAVIIEMGVKRRK